MSQSRDFTDLFATWLDDDLPDDSFLPENSLLETLLPESPNPFDYYENPNFNEELHLSNPSDDFINQFESESKQNIPQLVNQYNPLENTHLTSHESWAKSFKHHLVTPFLKKAVFGLWNGATLEYQAYFRGEQINFDIPQIAIIELIENFKDALISESTFVIEAMWKNNPRLQTAFGAETNLINIQTCLWHFRVALASRGGSTISKAIWNANSIFLSTHISSLPIPSQVDVLNAVCVGQVSTHFIKLYLQTINITILEIGLKNASENTNYSATIKKLMQDRLDCLNKLKPMPKPISISKQNSSLFFPSQKSPTDPRNELDNYENWSTAFRKILLERNQKVIIDEWNKIKWEYKALFMGSKNNLGTDLKPLWHQITISDCHINFTIVLHSKHEELIYLFWKKNSSALIEYQALLNNPSEQENILYAVLSSSRLGNSQIVSEYICSVNDTKLLAKCFDLLKSNYSMQAVNIKLILVLRINFLEPNYWVNQQELSRPSLKR